MGYRLGNPELLQSSANLGEDYAEIMQALAALRGGGVSYVPLFTGFPNEVPDDNEYFVKRLVGYFVNTVVAAGLVSPTASDNTWIPSWLFDSRKFGANPVTQLQTKATYEAAKKGAKGRSSDSHTQWIDLELASTHEAKERLQHWLQQTLYAKAPIKHALHADISTLLTLFGAGCVETDRIVIKENLALVAKLLWLQGDLDAVVSMLATPTDVLRLLAATTDSDVSLAKPVSFPKLRRSQRRAILTVLESSSALTEDLARYRGLWLALGRGLHPGEFQKSHPKCAQAFNSLRNGKIATFHSRAEVILRNGSAKQALEHLGKRPGVLGRRIHELTRVFPQDTPAIMASFESLSADMVVKNLLVLQSYFANINELEHRTVINKRGMIKVVTNNARGALSKEQLDRLAEILQRSLSQKLSKLESWAGKKVWIDPRLSSYTVPLQQRAASDGILSLGRGSRVPVDLSRALRLFVYWKESGVTTDLDLSLIQFDSDFKYLGHVSFTKLADQGIVHSGDMQSAPLGAAEFIDLSMKALPRNVCYLAVQVHRYEGSAFADMDCHAGWMVREEIDATYSTFDIKTVVHKFDLQGSAGYCVPCVVDLRAAEMIMTDLYMGGGALHNTVEGSHWNVGWAVREIARFTDTRPTLHQLASLHVAARSAQLTDKSWANIRFGIDKDCTYSAHDPTTLLAQLL